MSRILINLLIVLSVFVFPPYVSALIILLAIFFINNFFETIAWGALIDILYGGGTIFGLHFAYFFTAIIFIFYLFSFKFKKMLRLSFR